MISMYNDICGEGREVCVGGQGESCRERYIVRIPSHDPFPYLSSHTLPLIRKGWLQHFLSSIMTLSREGTAEGPPFDRNVKFLSKMAR